MEISEATEVTDELVEAFQRLLPQLSSSARPIGWQELQEIVNSQAVILLIARDEGKIVGSLALVVFRIPTAVRAWIEDVIVDQAARGRGIGEAITREAVARARALGAQTIDLTSRPSREVANRLYQRVGFVQRSTNVYRYQLPSGGE